MKYRTFTTLGKVTLAGIVALIGWGGYSWFTSEPAVKQVTAQTAPAPAPTPAIVPQQAPIPSALPPERPSTAQIRQTIEAWLTQNPDRGGRTKAENAIPGQSFRATLYRFPEADAVKWSNNPSQWSQVKLDLDRNGVDDEKWLLKNGHTYKREVIDGAGKATFTEYFK